MNQQLADLQQQFQLERLEVNLFRGQSRDTGSAQVFGGQVLGQALKAAYATLHMWTQVVGKTRLALAPMENHW